MNLAPAENFVPTKGIGSNKPPPHSAAIRANVVNPCSDLYEYSPFMIRNAFFRVVPSGEFCEAGFVPLQYKCSRIAPIYGITVCFARGKSIVGFFRYLLCIFQ